MKVSTSTSILFLGGLLISATAAQATVDALSVSGSAPASEVIQIQGARGLQFAQQTQSGKGTEQQSKPQEPEHAPGCRYRGGEELQLLV